MNILIKDPYKAIYINDYYITFNYKERIRDVYYSSDTEINRLYEKLYLPHNDSVNSLTKLNSLIDNRLETLIL